MLFRSLGTAFVRGLQGNDPQYLKTVATVKHFAVHSGPEPSRHRFDAVISDRDRSLPAAVDLTRPSTEEASRR